MHSFSRLSASLIALTLLPFSAAAQDGMPTLITNVNVFDGVNETLIENANVVVTDNLISQISTEPLAVAGGKVIDGGGRTMIPGLIDVHWHTSYCCTPQNTVVTGDILEVAIRGAKGSEATLMRGFTTVRDLGGNPLATKKMIDAGELLGPRILPSGPPISQTGGHFDYRPYQAVPTNPADSQWYWYSVGLLGMADGVDEVIKRTREVMRMGASQIKIAGGGGVSSIYDPLDARQFTMAELKAFVEVAETYNTYVASHLFTDDAIQAAIEAGVKSIEHGFLMSRETMEMMRDNDVWLSIQPLLDDEDGFTFDDPYSQAKWVAVTNGTDAAYKMAKEVGVKVAFGTDILFDPALAERQGAFLAKLQNWYSPYEILKMATSTNAELLALSGPRHPYQDGALGVIEEGAYADLILVDGNPLEDIDLVADPHANFDLIMKDGKVYKNEIE
ncbi:MULTISPECIES: metal-dependent hydrolase family protein [Halocynthiibacter]|uniref:Amidohydrolase family protein n=1 Tax=Halocynthiibacter halioticoli TaxID=2986804 RepID=A0AAE3LUF3_9RHOB|nr:MULTISPECIES: amidohydrolase family protein [Halocynthiibacter]MCV6823980.1 amidohydrolase family protein [Halocynthiibacter halioticoli]MCW4056981.1 amidohydrolase family protein [Halocynthiibacter sp. SDUM655004]MDE0589993.1 amidohydrolase family protein [Halocynthiibacter sp. C4]